MLLVGDVRERLRTIPPQSVHCAITSPPYWGLRAYGTDPQIWGGDPNCRHIFDEYRSAPKTGGPTEKQKTNSGSFHGGGACGACGAWRGELGSEPTPQLFIAHMVDVFAEVWRVLRDDGTLWVNLGDSFCSGTRTERKPSSRSNVGRWQDAGQGNMRTPAVAGLKPKELCGMPWRFAFAMQDFGWYLRRDIIWAKRSPMPESVNDRPTTAHEYIFLFSKQPRYFYDGFAIRESAVGGQPGNKTHKGATAYQNGDERMRTKLGLTNVNAVSHRNARSVWTFSNHPVKEAHFATFPPALPERCIKAGTSKHGCCPTCGTPWRRLTRKVRRPTRPGENTKVEGRNSRMHVSRDAAHQTEYEGKATDRRSIVNRDPQRHVTETIHVGWYPGCQCIKAPALPALPKKPREQDQLEAWMAICEPIHAEREAICRDLASLPVVPAVVLEPFLGSGTTGMMAEYLRRDWIGIELNPKYAEIAAKRIEKGYAPPSTRATAKHPAPSAGQMTMFA